MTHPMTLARARSVAVVGSGTAGLFAAMALRRARPDWRVAIVASPTIPVIGVGEATTPPIVAFLHGFLGLDETRLFRAVRPTWKLGIRFEWGRRPFHYAFGGGDLGAAQTYDGHILDYSLVSMLMQEGRGRIGGHRYAYHLDNAPFVAFLEAEAHGIERISATVRDVVRDDVGGVEALVVDGGRLAFDAYVDATGFRSQLLGGALGVPFASYESSLFCDAAVVGNGPADAPAPYTRAATMDAGWCWTIPMRGEDHHGYVFSTAFLDADAAERELRSRRRIEGDVRLVRFRSGRRARAIEGNVASIGNAYGFVEPLESTALHMAIATALRLAGLAVGRGEPEAVSRDLGDQWDYLRGFLAMHYRFNHARDTAFWRHCRAAVDLRPLDGALEEYRRGTLFTQRHPVPAYVRDTVFGARGLDLVLLGQDERPGVLTAEVEAETWARRKRAWRAAALAAPPHEAALEAPPPGVDRWVEETTSAMVALASPRN